MRCPDCGGRRYRRNADRDLQRLERQYAAGDFEAGVQLLYMRMRSGEIPVDYVRRAAALGDRRSEALGLEPWLYWPRADHLDIMDHILYGLPKNLIVSFAVDSAERVLYIFEDEYPGDTRPRDAIEAARRMAEDPSEENSDAAYTAAEAHTGENNYPSIRAYSAAFGDLPPQLRAAAADYAHAAAAFADWASSGFAYESWAAAHAAYYATRAATDEESERSWQKQRLIQYVLGEIEI